MFSQVVEGWLEEFQARLSSRGAAAAAPPRPAEGGPAAAAEGGPAAAAEGGPAAAAEGGPRAPRRFSPHAPPFQPAPAAVRREIRALPRARRGLAALAREGGEPARFAAGALEALRGATLVELAGRLELAEFQETLFVRLRGPKKTLLRAVLSREAPDSRALILGVTRTGRRQKFVVSRADLRALEEPGDEYAALRAAAAAPPGGPPAPA